MSFLHRLQESRWRWFAEGLPSIPRSLALFHARRYTMTNARRCKHLWDICSRVLDDGVPGDFVECGVWKGGSAGVMGLVLKHRQPKRTLHLFDSFEGLPEPTIEDGAFAAQYSGGRASGALTSVNQCRSDLPEVEEFLFRRLGLNRALIKFHAGWFQDTIPQGVASLGNISVLRLDGDWYESTRICLEYLYPLVSAGGVVILDDFYCWEGCARAAEEFRSRLSITAPLHRIDQEAVFWRVEPAR
jgi:O-methyltransferase